MADPNMMFSKWYELEFGRHKGTLPQVGWLQPSWLGWALERKVFSDEMLCQAEEVWRKSRNIKFPGNDGAGLAVEMVFDSVSGKFSELRIVSTSAPLHEGGSPALRQDRIDLGAAYHLSVHDRTGAKLLVACAKRILFGATRVRLTRARCEQFFDNECNFLPDSAKIEEVAHAG